MPFTCSSNELFELLSNDEENIDQKITVVTVFKTQVKRESIEISEVASYFRALAIGVKASEKRLYYPCFSCVCHLIRKTNMQDSSALAKSASIVIPVLIDGMGDQKSSVNDLAGRTLFDSWLSAPDEVEKEIKRCAFRHDNAKVRYGILRWLQSIAELQPSFPSRSFGANVIPMLQDEDSHIRDIASDLLISMYRDAPDARKCEFQKALNASNVRPSVCSFLLREIGFYGQAASTEQLANQLSNATTTQVIDTQPNNNNHSNPAAENILSSIEATTLDIMEAVSVSSSMALEDEFANGRPFFEGKETELNWQPRERSLIRLRGILRGNAADDFPAVLAGCLQEFTPSIIKAALSLRTTLSSNAVQLIKDGFLILGMRLDAMTDIYLPALIKLTASTKKITIQNAHGVICTILARASYHQKALSMILACASDKNVSPRKCSATWLKLFLARNENFRGTIENNSSILEEMGKFLKKGLGDANPSVRIEMRETFWYFYNIWPSKGQSIISTLDVQVRKALEKSKLSTTVQGGANASAVHLVSGSIEGSQRAQNRPSVREFVKAKAREIPRNVSGSSRLTSNSSISSERNNLQSSQVSNATISESVPGLSAKASRPRLGAPSRAPNPVNQQRRPAIPTRVRPPAPQSSSSPPRAKRTLVDSTKRSFDSATASSSRRAESPHGTVREQQMSNRHPRPAHERSLSATACSSLRSSTSTDEPKDGISKAASMTKLEIRKPIVNKHQSGLLSRLQEQNPNIAKSAANRIITILAANDELPETIEGVEINAFSDAFAKLLADPHPELSSFLVSCENIKSLLRLLPKDINLIAQAVLLDETDGYSRGQRLQIISQNHTLLEIFELTWKIIAGLAPQNSGPSKNPMNFPYFNSPQRKAAMHGTLALVDKALEESPKALESCDLNESDSFGSLSRALLDALWYIRASPLNYYLLISLLEKLYGMNPSAFDTILSTCQKDTVNELRRKWTIGTNNSDSNDQKSSSLEDDRSSAAGDDEDDGHNLDQLTIIDLDPSTLKQFSQQQSDEQSNPDKEEERQVRDIVLPDQTGLISSHPLDTAIKVHEDKDAGKELSSLKLEERSWYKHQLAKLDSSGGEDKQINEHEAALDFIKGWKNERVSVSTYKGVLRLLSRPIPEKTDKENNVIAGLDYNDLVIRIVVLVVDYLKTVALDCTDRDRDEVENSMEGLGQGLMLLCHVLIHNGEVMKASSLQEKVFAVLADIADSEDTLKIANGTLRMALEDTAHCYAQAVPTDKGLEVCLDILGSQDAVHGQDLKQYGRSGQGFILDCLRLFIEKGITESAQSKVIVQSGLADASTLAINVMHTARRRLEDGDPTVRLASVLLLVQLRRFLLTVDGSEGRGEDMWNREINKLREAHQMLVSFYVSKATTEIPSN